MSVCAVCGSPSPERAHVKPKCTFEESFRNHDFFNIIPLCSYHHHEYFDKGLIYILEHLNSFLILTSIKDKKYDLIKSWVPINIKPEYIIYKNSQSKFQLRLRAKKYI